MRPRRRAPRSLIVFFGVLALSWASGACPVSAQYFGRNSVRYESFDFRILKTEHFDIYYYDDAAEAVPLVARMAERWLYRLTRVLGHELRGRQPIVLYASHPHFVQTTALLGTIGEGTGGATEPFKRRVVLPLVGPLAETDHVLGHELVHAFQFDMTTRSGFAFAPPTASVMPLWFIEGMAEYLSVGPVDPNTTMWMREAVRAKRLPTIRQLASPRYFPYRYGQAFWAYLAGRWGDHVPGDVLRRSSETGAVLPVMRTMLGNPDSLAASWKKATEEAYAPLADSTRAAVDYGRAVVAPDQGGGKERKESTEDRGGEGGRRRGRLNLAPALSPDGTRLVFLSERGGVSIDMFLADAVTGEVQRKIVSTTLDPHFESLQFANSAGAWHPDGRRFIFAGVSRGRPVLFVLDVERGKIEREFTVSQVQQVFHPSWSPDGTRLVFSALVGGLSDLFILDLASGDVRRLTHDAFADLQPAWSPDGNNIALVTDRFTTDLATLAHGAYRLALIDPVSGDFRALPSFPGSKHINPQWGPDGTSLYFLSDRNGITNIYRLTMATQEIRQLTNLYTGVGGLTALSPALAVAQRSPRLVFSAYGSERYDLYAIDSAAALAGEPLRPAFAVNPAILPPADRSADDGVAGDLAAHLADARSGLPPADSAAESDKYRPRLSLDFVNPVSVGVGGGGAFGTFVGGGSALFWSDMLGQHRLTTGLQVFGGFADLAALAAYRNVRSRVTWGVGAGQTPLLSIGFRRGGSLSQDSVVVDSLFRYRQTDRQIAGIVSYPFSRVQRIEISAGYRHSSFDSEVLTRSITTNPPQVTVADPVDLPAPSSISQWEASVALVRDNTLFGPTSPVLGQRYRLEVSPSIGELTYYGVLVDYRRYITPKRPYTLAGRLLHYARYGPNSDDERLVPLFIGYQSLVRGYSARSFDLRECPAFIRQPDDCPVPVFEELIGSRILVGNLELRFPLFEGLRITDEPPPGLPWLDLALFFDAGVAWLRSDQPQFLGGDRRVLSSYGVALRVNLFGAAILELDVVHPNNRPGRRWYTQFGFAPGF